MVVRVHESNRKLLMQPLRLSKQQAVEALGASGLSDFLVVTWMRVRVVR